MRFRVVDAILDLVEGLASERPVLLVLDDVHWADASSVVVIDQIVRRLSDRPVSVVVTLRPSPRSAALEKLIDDAPAERTDHVGLGPLPCRDVRSLAETIIGAPPGPRLLAQVAGAAGNPFFVAELLAALVEDDAIAMSADGVDVAGPSAPASLRVTILRRMGFLPAGSLDVLRVAAVLGSPFCLDDLSLVLDKPASVLLSALEKPREVGALTTRGSELGFRHDLVREAIYHDLPDDVRRALHLQVGRMLGAAGRNPSDVAMHFQAGAASGDTEAVGWLRHAARDAMSRAPNIAADLYASALKLSGDGRDLRDELSVELAVAQLWSGQHDEGAALLRELGRRPHSSAIDARARLGLAQILLIQGRPQEAVERCDELVGSTGIGDWERARGLTDAAVARLLTGDVEGARADAELAIALGRRIADDPAVCGGLCALSWTANLAGRTEQAVELGEEAVALAASSPLRETSRRYPHCFVAIVLMDADRLDDGRRMFDAGRRVAEELGDAWPLPIHHFGAALASFYAGRYDDAETELTTATSIAEEVGIRTLMVWGHALAAQLAIHRDDLDDAEQQLAAGEHALVMSGPGMGYDWLLWSRALLHEATGDPDTGLSVLRSAWDVAAALGILSQRRLIAPDLVRLALRAGETELACTVADAMEDTASRSSVGSVRAVALRCRGTVESDPDLMLASVAAHRAGPRLMDFGFACEDAARVLASLRRRDEARGLFGEALATYERCGATRDRRRVQACLRELGVTHGARGARRRPAVGWDALTDTEREVTRLAAQGLTNPEIGRRLYVSRRTVETHLSHVFGKLGVRSRVELAGHAARRTA